MRSNGILLPISALPSNYGIGTLGSEAYKFVDFLNRSNVKYWQVLPLGITGFGDSPYQSVSSFAGGFYYIDYDLLVEDGYLTIDEILPLKEEVTFVDYGKLYLTKEKMLRLAYKRFIEKLPDDFFSFCKDNASWLDDFALYMSLKKEFQNQPFFNWPKPYKHRDSLVIKEFISNSQDEIGFWNFTQYIFFKQWKALKLYANVQGINIIGDLPIYVAADSCDVWSNTQEFLLDEELVPTKVAGVPPDYFSETGQLWGNPIYDYDVMKKNHFKWWIMRFKHFYQMYDVIRLDHFRGFASYYVIDKDAKDAKNGKWLEGPGINLFNEVFKHLPNINLIAEDLGFLTEDVFELLKLTKLPGMKIMEFGLLPDMDSEHSPHNYQQNLVVYPGTHDNMPIKSWFEELPAIQKEYVLKYLNIKNAKTIVDSFLKRIMASHADLVIVQLQDYLMLDKSSRMNEPGTLGNNWKWRVKNNQLNKQLETYISNIVTIYYR